MVSFKVEQMMFMRLNQGFIPEVEAHQQMAKKQKNRREKCVPSVAAAQSATAGEIVAVDLVS